MDAWLSKFLQIAWTQCWQVTLLIVLVSVLVWLFGKSRPHLASVLWLLVIFKCVTPPVWSSPSGVFCWLQPASIIQASHDSPQSTLPRADRLQDPDAVVVQLSSQEAAANLDTTESPFAVVAESPARTQSFFPSLAIVLSASWFSGLLLYGLLVAFRWRKCWRDIQILQTAASPELTQHLSELKTRLNVRRPVRLLITSSAVGPAVVGLWRPTIVLPQAIVANQQASDLELLLAHELVHIRRGDLWIALLQMLVNCLWWFHPLVRWANQWLTRETERSCDEEVIATVGCNPAAYARSLLSVLELKQQLHPVPTFPGVRPVDVTRQRLERIMQLGQGCHRRTPWWCWAILIALAAVTLPGAALLVRAKEKPAATGFADSLNVDSISLTAGFGEAATSTKEGEEAIVATYEIIDLLAKLENEVVDNQPAAQVALIDLLRVALPNGGEAGNEKQFGWHNGRLVVRTTATGHKALAEQIAIYRETGFQQYSMEIRILRAADDLQTVFATKWETIAPDTEDKDANFDAWLDSPDDRSHAESIIQRRPPAISTIVEDAQVKALLGKAQSDKRTQILSAPKVTTINGQSCRVESGTMRPFVVGLKGLPDKSVQPLIRTVTEGWKLRLRSTGLKSGKIKLDFALAQSEVRKVDVAKLPLGNVQIPEVAISRVQTRAELTPGQTLVIGGVDSVSDNAENGEPLWILVRVQQIDEPLVEPNAKKSDKTGALFPDIPGIQVPRDSGIQPDIVTKVYDVSQLAPSLLMLNSQAEIPPVQASLLASGVVQLKKQDSKFDGEALVEFITQTIEPQSWVDFDAKDVSIELAADQSSLIVTQYEHVHARISDLLEEMQRWRNGKVVLSLKEVWIPESDWRALSESNDHSAWTNCVDARWGYTPLQSQAVALLLNKDARHYAQFSKLMAYNLQPVELKLELSTPGKSERLSQLAFRPVVKANLSAVNLTVMTSSLDDGELLNGPLLSLAPDETAVIDISRTDWRYDKKQGALVTRHSPSPQSEDAGPQFRKLLLVRAEVFFGSGVAVKRFRPLNSATPE
ncbi:M56 family metallopeptidase [Anatilimnocola sp. NA78]|uniref:M56 family metallopeptidase n=1 Tax=Anatilimnocola sp. NA78 TaxID=3415683 RepID=UPI003CE49D5E